MTRSPHRLKSIVHILAFTAVCFIAVLFRFTGINWDSNAHLHPDERFLTMVTMAISWPNTIPQYFDTTLSPASPHNKGFAFFVYGTYPMYLTKYVAQTLHRETYNDVTLIGRVLSGIVDLWTVLLVFLLGLRLSPDKNHRTNLTAALLAALLYALMVLPIQLSHFYTVDPFATLFLTVALLLMIRGTLGLPLGIAIGLAASAKISALLILPVAAVAYILRWPWFGTTREHWKQRAALIRTGVLLCLGGLATIRIAYPYLFTGWTLNPKLLANWEQLSSFNGPTTSFPPGLQWIGVSPLQPVLDLVVWGLGLPLGILAAVSIIVHIRTVVSHMLRKHFPSAPQDRGALLLALWIGITLVYESTQFAKAMRYAWPAYPALAVLSALFLDRMLTAVSRRLRPYAWILTLVLLVLWPLCFRAVYSSPNTRVAASRWIYETIPQKKIIAWEHWDDPLPIPLEHRSISVYQTLQLPMFDPDTTDKWAHLSQMLHAADYVVLSSNRVYGSTGRIPARYPYTATYYRALFSGTLGFEKITEFTSRPGIPVPMLRLCIRPPGFSYGDGIRAITGCPANRLTIIDDYAEETFTVYDHPTVSIFQNIRKLPAEDLFRLITAHKPAAR